MNEYNEFERECAWKRAEAKWNAQIVDYFGGGGKWQIIQLYCYYYSMRR